MHKPLRPPPAASRPSTATHDPFSLDLVEREWVRRVWRAHDSCWRLLMVSLRLAIMSGLWVVQPVHAANPPAVQTYYVPLPEQQLLSMFQAINTGSNADSVSPVISSITLSPLAGGTLIYYDHWEDGYESDITNPTQASTGIWGDGKLANGAAPGVNTDAGDVIRAGGLIALSSSVATSTTAISITPAYQFNGRDKIAVSKTIAMSRVTWATGSTTNLAQATVVFDTTNWGTEFRSPVGQNATNAYAMFEYAAFAVMAGKGGATIQVDWDANGTTDYTQALVEGQSYITPTGSAGATSLNVGARVTSDKPVQVNLLTGDINDSQYKESRDGALLPIDLWDTHYYAPASTTTANGTRVWLYNPGASALTVTSANRGTNGTGVIATSPVSVPAGGSASVTLPVGTGAHFYASSPFYAFSTIDSIATATGAGNTANSSFDWGYPLNPGSTLASQFLVGYARGGSSGTENSAPVWVTPVGNGDNAVTVYVDFRADGVTNTGTVKTDPRGNQYDLSYSLKELQQQKIYTNISGTYDQSGVLVYVLPATSTSDPLYGVKVKLSGAWGEDPLTATLAAPGMDAGTGMVPAPLFDLGKTPTITVDADGDGRLSPGDTIQYEIRVNNTGRVPVSNLLMTDVLPNDVTYVPNTTQVALSGGVDTAIADDASGTAFPLDGAGYSLSDYPIPVGGHIQVIFRVTVNPLGSLTMGVQSIANSVTASAAGGDSHSSTNIKYLLEAINHSYQTFLNTAFSGNTSVGDTYPPNSTFSYASPAHGTISNFNTATGTYTYTPSTGYSGLDSFTYTICMPVPQATNCVSATESITIVSGSPVNLTGTVFLDLNLNKLQSGTGETGTNGGGPLYVTAINVSTNQTIATAAVASNGAFTLPVAQNTTYNLVLSTAAGGTFPTLPSGYVTTGENQNGTVDAYADGQLSVAVVASNVNNLNFGIVYAADLSISKTNGVTRVTRSSAPTYTITVTNNGPNAVSGATVTDTAPSGLTFGTWTCTITATGSGSGSNACGAASGSGNLNTTVTLRNGAAATYTVNTTVGATPTVGSTLTNTASVTAPSGIIDQTPGNNSASDGDIVLAATDLSISKTDGVTSVDAGGTLSYTITLTNTGNTVTNVTVTDPVVTGLVKTGTPACAVTGTATCPSGVNLTNALLEGPGVVIPSMNSGSTVTLTVTAAVTATSGSVTNTATSNTADTNAGNNSASDTDTVNRVADLSILKTDGVASVNAGGATSYTLTLTNNGPSAANGAVLKDPTAAGLAKTGSPGCAAADGAVCPAGANLTHALLEGAGVVIPTLPSGGSLIFTITANVTAGSGAVINTATVTTPSGISDTLPGNNTASDTDTVIPFADLSLTKTNGAASINAGGATTYTIIVSNNGPSDVTAAPVTDTAPAGLTFGAWTCAITAPGTGSVTNACGAASGSGHLNTTVTLKNGAAATYTVNATVAGTATGSLANTATVTAPGGTTDAIPGNDSATDTDTVIPVADLAITKTDGVTGVNPGGAISYTLTVVNQGPSDVTAATVSDTAPAGVSFGAWTCTVTNAGSGGSVTTACGAASGSGNLATSVTMKTGAVITYTIPATVSSNASGTLANSATVTAPGGTIDANAGNNTATDTDTVFGRIGNYVWYDANHDGIQDPAERGIAGLTVQLRDSGGVNVLQTAITDGAGFYQFSGVVDGTYVVHFVPPSGYGFSPANQGSGALATRFDSNADPNTFNAVVTLSGAADLTVDAGLYIPNVNPARIGDFVWYDTNHDGVQDGGEPGLGGVTVSLYADANSDGTPDGAALAATLSDATGFYEFAGLPAGNYVLGFSAPAGYTRSPTGAGTATDSDANPSTGLTPSLTLAAGANLTAIDAGLYLTGSSGAAASIGDFVWYDTNQNGIQEGGEPGIPGVVVKLYDATGTTLMATATTSPSGAYRFAGLAAGTYTIEFDRPNASYAFSPTGAGTSMTDSNADPGTGRVLVSVSAGQQRTDIDAGLSVSGQSPISIGDFVWKDANGNTTPDANEGLAGAQVVLYDSLGKELARLTTTATTVTAANYTFTGVPAGGSYRVAIDTSTLAPANLVQIADPDGTPLDNRTDLITPSAATTAVDFGYTTPAPAITIDKRATNGTDTQNVLDPGTAYFEISITNTGNLTLTQVAVTDPFASDCVHVAGTLAPNAQVTYTCAKNSAAGSVGAPGTDWTNRVDVTGQPVDGNGDPVMSPVSSFDTSTVLIIKPAITIAKTATTPSVNTGNPATFAITVTNTGNVALTNVTVTDALAPDCNRTFASLPASPGPGNAATYTCTSGNLTAALTNVAVVTGTATSTSTPPSALPTAFTNVTATDDASVIVTVPGMSITKTASTPIVRAGGAASFTIRVTNTGESELTGVEVTDANAADCDRTTAKGNAVGTIAVGQYHEYTCTQADITSSFTNTASADSTKQPPAKAGGFE